MKSEPASLVAPLRNGGANGSGLKHSPVSKAAETPTVNGGRQISTASPNIQILTRQTAPLPVLAPVPRWPFFVADGVLLGAVIALLALSPRPWSPSILFLSVLLVTLGGVVAVLPFFIAPRPAQRSGDATQPHPKLRITLH